MMKTRKQKRKRRTILCAVLFPATVLCADVEPLFLRITDPVALTLESAIKLALRDSNQAISARISRDEQRYALQDVEDRYKFEWNVSSTLHDPLRSTRNGRVGVGSTLQLKTGGGLHLAWSKSVLGTDSDAIDLSVSQPLLQGFGTELEGYNVRRVHMQEQINVRTFRDNAIRIIDSVISAWRSVQSVEKRTKISQEALERAQNQLRITKTMIQAGRQAPQDLLQFEASVANRQYDVTDSNLAVRDARERLSDILDLEEGIIIDLIDEEKQVVAYTTPTFESSLATAFQNRTDWLQANTAVTLGEMRLKEAKDGLRPNVNLDASMQYDLQKNTSDWGTFIQYNKILGDDKPQRRLEKARSALRIATMNRKETERNMRVQVRRILHNISSALRQIDIAREGGNLSKQKLDVERRKLKAGLSTPVQLTLFENDFVIAQQRELDANLAHKDAIAKLHSFLGTTLDQWGIDITIVGQ